jgi:hypothetical protein
MLLQRQCLTGSALARVRIVFPPAEIDANSGADSHVCGRSLRQWQAPEATAGVGRGRPARARGPAPPAFRVTMRHGASAPQTDWPRLRRGSCSKAREIRQTSGEPPKAQCRIVLPFADVHVCGSPVGRPLWRWHAPEAKAEAGRGRPAQARESAPPDFRVTMRHWASAGRRLDSPPHNSQ